MGNPEDRFSRDEAHIRVKEGKDEKLKKEGK